MRISLLLQREPFGEILEQTLSDFFRKYFGQKFSVKWHSKRKADNPKGSGQVWLCNPYTNAIFTPGVDRAALQPVLNEFSRSPIWWRRPVQRIYVLLASCRATSSLTAPYLLIITPPVKESERYVILGGNHHIRLIDSKIRQCFVICKAGFDRDMLAQDIETRRQHPFLPAPRICDFDKEFSWYSEDFISGTPINRLKNIEKANAAVESVSTALKRLYESTLENIPLSHYSKRLTDRIGTAVSLNKLLSGSDKSQILSTADTIKQILSPERKQELRTVQSHGDFQPANILADDDNTWLIDWEYTQRRQAAYDSLVFSLQSRFPDGFCHRVETALNGSLAVINHTACFNWAGKASRHISLALFLLEEIDLRLTEISNPMILKIDNGFFTFADQAAEAAQKLLPI